MATKTWNPGAYAPYGDGASWGDANNWTDGGSFRGVPGIYDDVVVSTNDSTLTLDGPYECSRLTFAGTTGCVLTLANFLTVSVALVLVAAMSVYGDRANASWGTLTDPYGFFTQYTVTATATNGSPGIPTTVYKGFTAQVGVTANAGYLYDSIDAGASWAADVMTVYNVTATATYNVTFKVAMKINGVYCVKFCGVTAMKINGM